MDERRELVARASACDVSPLQGPKSAGSTGCGKTQIFCHSERSEESLLDPSPTRREIPRRNARLGMTKTTLLPQPVKPVQLEPKKSGGISFETNAAALKLKAKP